MKITKDLIKKLILEEIGNSKPDVLTTAVNMQLQQTQMAIQNKARNVSDELERIRSSQYGKPEGALKELQILLLRILHVPGVAEIVKKSNIKPKF